MVELGCVFIDGGKQRRICRDAGNLCFHIGLIDCDLGGIDGLGLGDTDVDAGAPILGIHGFAFPECGNGQIKPFGASSNDPIDMTADTAIGDGESKLLTIGTIAFARVDVEASRTQPTDRQILKRMADGEDAQRLAGKAGAVVLGRRRKLILQGALARLPEAGAAKVVAWRRGGLFGFKGGNDQGGNLLAGFGLVIIVQHQNGTSGTRVGLAAVCSRSASWKPVTATSIRVSTCCSERSASRVCQPISSMISATGFMALRIAACSASVGSIIMPPSPGPVRPRRRPGCGWHCG